MRQRKAIIGMIIPMTLLSCCSRATKPIRGTATQGSIQKIELVARDFAFEPQTVHVAGEEFQGVAVHVVSRGSVIHNLTIPRMDFNKDLSPGNTLGALLTFPESGTYTFYCRFHRDKGMTGTIQVILSTPSPS
jgi:plastocyanin